MNTEAPLPDRQSRREKRPALRPLFLAAVLGLAAFFGLLLWPVNPGISPIDLSREDGRSRFYTTTFSKMVMPPNLTLRDRLFWTWRKYQRLYEKRNPTACSFAASPVQLWSIHGLLNQCMDVTGTRYWIAVEIAGAVEFGSTNALNGAQWVAAIEHAIEASNPVVCYDYSKRRNFQDTLVVIRERPGVVKIVPRTKLGEYEKAGLVRGGT